MEKIITKENLRNFAYVNDDLCTGPIQGIVVEFFGLGGMKMYEEHPFGSELAAQNILLVVPYFDPWCWMNRQAVAFTDEILNVLFEAHGLAADTPIVSTGGSMGGLCALVYSRYAKRIPAACVANCPVCDLPYHYTERPDLPRTLYSAFWSYDGTMEEALRSASPLHLADTMPDIPYCIFHCTADEAVNKQKHSDRFVAAMAHRRVEYIPVPERGHCDLGEEMLAMYRARITAFAQKN